MTQHFLPKQQLPPHVRIWDSVTLNTLHVVGIGFFDRAVTCIAFSKSVSVNPVGLAALSTQGGETQLKVEEGEVNTPEPAQMCAQI